MSLGHSASIVRDGIVFHMDMENSKKSWKGKPTTNLVDPDLSTWSANDGIVRTAVNKSSRDPADHVYTLQDSNTSGYSNVSKVISVVNDTGTYTISVYIEKPSEPTANLGFNYGISGGSTIQQYTNRLNPSAGTVSGGTLTDLGTWWRWSIPLTNNGSGNTSMYVNFYPATGPLGGSDNNSAVATVKVCGMQVEKQSFATPFVDGTRSDTQALIDLTGNQTITANSLIYPSDGTFNFNGSQYATISGSIINTGAFTVDSFVEINNATNNNKTILGVGDGSNNGFWFFKHRSGLGGSLVFHGWDGVNPRIDVSTSTVTPHTEPFHAAVTFDGTTYQLYLNGEANGNAVVDNAVAASTVNYIGRHHTSSYLDTSSKVYNLKVYNRALSAAEIRQNFNAHKGRYGL